MALFAVLYTYSDATTDGRDTHRATHRGWLADLLDKEVLVTSGPYPDGTGALIIVRGDSVESVTELFTHDPFAVEGLIDASRIVEWKPVMGTFSD